MSLRKGFNPFYPLLVTIGVVFAMTACAYGVMTVRKIRDPRQAYPHPLMEMLDEHGFSFLMVEIGALAAATFAAIGTDSYWQRRASSGDAASDPISGSSALISPPSGTQSDSRIPGDSP